MQSLHVFQPSPASARFYKLCVRVLQPASKRHQSTYRRSRSKLNIKPDPSFLPTKTETHDHIIYNPPPSMPNVYHTPTIFLPKSDRRRQLRPTLTTLDSPSATNPEQNTHTMPPPVRRPYEKRYHLTEKDVLEMRALRGEDPVQWSSTKLAKKFDCSPLYVRLVTKDLTREKQVQQKAVTEAVKSSWGPRRTIAREDRALRKDRWYRDE